MQYPQSLIEEGLALLAECPWTSKLVERPHAAVKSLMHAHASHGMDIMMAEFKLLCTDMGVDSGIRSVQV